MVRLVAALLVCVGALAIWSSPALAAGPVLLRPTSPGSAIAYAPPEATPYVTAHVVVHYVTSSPQAPPQTDANGNGYPDFVEEVGAAAETALTYYERHGFRLPAPDNAGPDSRLDVYVDTLPKGVFGFTVAPAHAEGGTFVVVSPSLDTTPAKPKGGVEITVAHELFHVIQYAYVPNGRLPTWAAEGSASAMSMRVFPRAHDQVMTEYMDDWLKAPWLPLYDERSGCVHCYGGAWWWLYLSAESQKVLPDYFTRLGADARRGVSTGLGVKQLDTAVKKSRLGSLFQAFTRFSLNLYRRGLPLGNPYKLRGATAPRASAVRPVYGLSAQYVPLRVPKTSRGVVVSVPSNAGPAPAVSLVLGGRHGRQVIGRRVHPGQGVVISALFRTARERNVVLIVASGSVKAARYAVQYVAVGRGAQRPGWVSFPGGNP